MIKLGLEVSNVTFFRYEGKGVTPGRHKVRIEKEGYESWEKEVVVKANEQTQVAAELKRMSGGVVIRTEPSGANIYIDSNPVGVSPYEGKRFSPGKHKTRVEKEGYEAWEETPQPFQKAPSVLERSEIISWVASSILSCMLIVV